MHDLPLIFSNIIAFSTEEEFYLPKDIGPIGHLAAIPGGQNFIDLASHNFQTIPSKVVLIKNWIKLMVHENEI